MKTRLRSNLAFLTLCTISNLTAQPYHTESIVSGIQTVEVEGDLSIKQYNGGLGGDFRVIGEARLAEGAQNLPGLPAGVTGHFFGPVKIGSGSNIVEYKFTKTGDNTTGDFIVPLGRFGDWDGTMMDLDVLTGPADSDSGGAHFKLMSKRHRGNGTVTALAHSAFGGGIGVKLHAWNFHGVTNMFLEFDATSNHNDVHDHFVVVRVSSLGSCNPFDRETTFSQMEPVTIADSIRSNSIWGNDMTHTLNAGNIVLNGDVAIPAGKAVTVGGNYVLTTSSSDSLVWRGNVSNGASFATGLASATGIYATANGNSSSQASGSYSSANGFNTIASGFASSATGFSTSASGGHSLGFGRFVTASGYSSTGYGFQSKARGDYSVAMGYYAEANSMAETAFGSVNLAGPIDTPNTWMPTSYLFHVGNGSNPSERSDALTILKNGQTTLTNKDWKAEYISNPLSALGDPASSGDSGGNALVVDGHSVLNGKVTISNPQGDISMGIYQ